MIKAAEQVLSAQQAMQSEKGTNIIHYTLREKEKHATMQHYPSGDRIDYDTGAQYFYHCHRENYDQEEHGHFHCFFRYKHIPKSLKPIALFDWDKHIDNPMTHLVCIAMNRLGQPIRLFSVNRWVTSEICYPALAMTTLLNKYKILKTDDPYWINLDRFVEGMIHLFAPQITWLAEERERLVKSYQSIDPDTNVYEDRKLEEICEIPINLHTQVRWLIDPELQPTSCAD